MIELRKVSFSFNGKAVLHDVSLTVEKGDFAVIVGNTGSGKTTLLQLLTGELLPTAGEIYVGSTRVDRLTKSQLAPYRRSIGIISEEISLLDEKTVAENVALPLEIAGTSGKEAIGKHVEAYLASVSLSEKSDYRPKALSRGEYQRTSIARALITEPLVLLADCPTQKLDPLSSAETLSILAEQNIRGMTVLLTMADLTGRHLLPAKTRFYRVHEGSVHRFLPETAE